MTESALLYCFWCRKKKLIRDDNRIEPDFINWLYSTSGFFDTSVKGTYFNFNYEKILKTEAYNQYFNTLLNIPFLNLNLHHVKNSKENIHIPFFLDDTTATEKNEIDMTTFFSAINNKKILIINPMSHHMKIQYESKKIHCIHPEFPNNIINITTYQNKYTFFNNKFKNCKENNAIDYLNNILNDIKDFDYDLAVVSCGAISCLIAHEMQNKNKEVVVIGGQLLTFFGITTHRNKGSFKNNNWLVIPESEKPKDYCKIENGCYW